MSFDKQKESALNGYPPLQNHLQQQLYSNNNGSQSNSSSSLPSLGNYHVPLYTGNNAFNRYATPQQQQKQPNSTGTGSPALNSMLATDVGNSIHVTKQLTFAQNSRQASAPHHHARSAATMARSTPVSSSVTITDPNNPNSNKIFNRIDLGSSSHDSSSTTLEEQKECQTWTTLDVGGMGLKQISNALFSYDFLTILYLNHNNLTQLTSNISKLVNLQKLDLSCNKLTHLPSEMGLLIHLRDLLLFDNNLTNLPSELGMLFQLEMLGLEGNPIQTDLKNILVKDGTKAVIHNLRDKAPVGAPPPQRKWITIENDTTTENEDDKFTILSYNTLCDKYATSQAYGYTPSWALDWDYRKDLIIEEILHHNTDIICLQELAMKHYDEVLGDAFKERGDYDGVFFPKSRARTMAEEERRVVDGCAIFYKASKYNLIEHHLLEYNQLALQRQDFKQSDDIYNRVMPKDNIAVMIILENKKTQGRLLVVNSHIHWDPQFADVKLVQVGMMMDEIEKYSSKHLKPLNGGEGAIYPSIASLPTLICGDFNSEPESGVYEFLSKSTIAQGHSDFGNRMYGTYTSKGLSHKLNLKSAYSHIGELDITNYTPGFKGTLDYIWYTNNTLDVLSLLDGIDQDYLDKAVGFPNPHFPSDHIAIAVEVKIKPPRHENKVEPIFSDSTQNHYRR